MLLRDGLRRAGDEVELLTSNVSVDARRIADHTAWASDAIPAKAVLQIANPLASARVRQVVRRFRPDVAWVNMFAQYLSPSAVLALGDVPFVLAVTDYKAVCPTGAKLLPGGAVCTRPAGRACLDAGCVGRAQWLRDQIRYRQIRAAVDRARAVYACGRSLERVLRTYGIQSDAEQLPVMPPRHPAGAPAAEPLFVFVGRLEIEKGVDTLVMAFALLRRRVPDARLRIVGRGPLRDSLEQMCDRLGQKDAIEFRGWRDPEEVERELDDAWALVAPSRWIEPQGLVATEALVRGVPAIVTDHGGLAEQVEPDVGGLCVPPDDVSALASAMEQIACGEKFRSHRLPADVVASSLARYDVSDHIRWLRRRFAEIARE